MQALRSEDEEALHKHIFILWYDDLLVNLWPPERFSVGRKVPTLRVQSLAVCANPRS